MGKGNFFSNLLGSLFGSNDPEAQKKKQLKYIAKNLQHTKYRFYKFNSHEADPTLAKFLYDIYKIISPAQLMFQNLTPSALKMMVINSSLSDEKRDLIAELSEENLKEMSRKMTLEQIESKIHQNYDTIMNDMDNLKIAKIDNMYSKFIAFKNFCTFDFYFTLKKFDSGMREHNFNNPPKFQAANGTYLAEDLKNFIDVAWALQFDQDWDDVFKMLKRTREVEPVTLQNWKRILVRLRPVKERKVLEMMVQLITETPDYREEVHSPDLHIIDEYLTGIKKTSESFCEQIKAKQNAAKADGLLKQIFGTSEIERLKYYNESKSAQFEHKGLGSFSYAAPLAFLKQFLVDYGKKDMRELSDILLIRAEWTRQQLSTPMSEAFHQLLETADQIIKLDGRLSDTTEVGLKLKTYLPRTDRDRDAKNIIMMLLGDVNDEAGQLLLNAMQNFVTYGRNLKMLLEDFVKPRGEIIMNWKDLDHYAEGTLKAKCVEVYKKIFALVSLLQSYNIKVSSQNEE